MNKTLFLISLLLSSAACAQTPDQGATERQVGDAAVSSNTHAAADAGQPTRTVVTNTYSEGNHKVSVATAAYDFEYSYPAVLAQFPSLEAHVKAEMQEYEQELAFLIEDSRAGGGSFGDQKLHLTGGWKVVAELPNWLSLSNQIVMHPDGPRQIYFTEAVLYHKQTGEVHKPAELFQSDDAFNAAVTPRYCAMLATALAKQSERADEVWECPRAGDQAVMLGSSNGETFNRLAVGRPEVRRNRGEEESAVLVLNIDAAILKAVKPEYAKDFAIAR